MQRKQVVKVIGHKTASPPGGLKKAQVQLYVPRGANVPSDVGTLAPPGEYD